MLRSIRLPVLFAMKTAGRSLSADLISGSAPTVHAPDAQNAINMVLYGLPAASGRTSAIMPGFADVLTNDQLNDLLGYLRQHFTDQPAWADVVQRAADTRTGKYHVSVRPSDGIERGPSNIGAEDQ